MLRYYEDDIQNLYVGTPSGVNSLMPTVKSLEHTLIELTGHFFNVRHIRCYGDTPQEILHFLETLNVAKIRALEMRRLGAYGQLQLDFEDQPPDEQYPSGKWALWLEMLSMLHRLQLLNIHHLTTRETAGSLAVFPNLIELRYLESACKAAEYE